jgi:DNA modification methylase
VTYQVLHGDCRDVMAQMDPESVDAIVTDPPYGLSFMGRGWDHAVPGVEFWQAALRVLKPGGHLLAFGGTRTFHRMAVAIEDAGFEIRDTLCWLYGSGFPKSLDVSKAIDRMDAGRHERALPVTRFLSLSMRSAGLSRRDLNLAVVGADNDAGSAQSWTTTVADGAHKPRVPTWDQWLQLKTLLEFGNEMDAEVWRLNGRKGQPGDNWELREVVGTKMAGIATPGDINRHTVGGSRAVEVTITAAATEAAKQWQGWGTALKPAYEPIILARKSLIGTVAANVLAHGTGAIHVDACRIGQPIPYQAGGWHHDHIINDDGWSGGDQPSREPSGRWPSNVCLDEVAADQMGDVSRFFYTAKASRAERHAGLADRGNIHPTCKPLSLMQWLVRLITPPNGVVLDPFTGSGSTGAAAVLEGFRFIGIEREAEYVEIAEKRIAHWAGQVRQPELIGGAA